METTTTTTTTTIPINKLPFHEHYCPLGHHYWRHYRTQDGCFVETSAKVVYNPAKECAEHMGILESNWRRVRRWFGDFHTATIVNLWKE